MNAIVPRHSGGAVPDRIAANLCEHGAVIVDGVLGDDLLRRFNAGLEQTSLDRSHVNPTVGFFHGVRVRQITGVASHSRTFGEEIE